MFHQLTNIEFLKSSATRSAETRGHRLGPWVTGITSAYAVCESCAETVFINTKARSSEVSIAGRPVAIQCGGFEHALQMAGGRPK